MIPCFKYIPEGHFVKARQASMNVELFLNTDKSTYYINTCSETMEIPKNPAQRIGIWETGALFWNCWWVAYA